MKAAIRRWTDRALDRIAVPYLFELYRRERLARQEFFYNAFKALRFNGIDGDYAEFGSWGGMTFTLAYRESRRHGHQARLWAFDSFQGLPESHEGKDEHPEWRRGKMATNVEEFHAICAANGVPRDAYEIVPGFYEDTLPQRLLSDPPVNIALAYVDCDLYTSTKTVLEFLRPRLKHGMIVAFDDYFCWSPTQGSGERTAWREHVANDETWEWVPYVQYGWSGQSYVLEAR
ncbi:MAG TPA: TylF/MycF/NovP-related O-methyltransferase [Gaiellaceae bacterium]|nr:TylF/MycF/NovP-related O-methyltransferase [Gaiellaceae bacterium]HWJ44698.1 TylF/MycF/NovP-related O-methyltransferase [Gaiellaceae bacterium]